MALLSAISDLLGASDDGHPGWHPDLAGTAASKEMKKQLLAIKQGTMLPAAAC